VTSAPLSRRARRDVLVARCQRERYELVAAAANVVPRARRMAHWVRATSRMLRVMAASLRALRE
jgi:hypothetical protein